MWQGKRRKELSDEASGLPLAKQNKLQETEKQFNLQETEKQFNLQETEKQFNLQETEKQFNLQETEKQFNLQETEKQSNLQETEKQFNLQETEKQSSLFRNDKQFLLHGADRQSLVNEAKKQTQLQETERQTQLQETEPQTQLQETEPQTQLQETERQTQLHETERQTQLQEIEKQTKLHETWNRHERKWPYPASSDANVPESSRVAVASNPLVGPQVHFPARSLTSTHSHHLDTQDGICLDEDVSKGQHKDTQLYIEKDVQNKDTQLYIEKDVQNKDTQLYIEKDVQNKDTQLYIEKDVEQINIRTATEVGRDPFWKVIESADIGQAIQLLKGDNRFTQTEIDRALISSCRRGFKYLVQTLFDFGANVQFKDTQGNTPLLICAENGFIDIVHFLLKKKADVNAFNSTSDTALILSIRAEGSLEMVRVLLEQEGIDISHQNQDGYTALMKAVEVRDVDVIKILMERYSNEETSEVSEEVSTPRSLKTIDAVNLNGMTAEQIAEKYGLGNIFHILKTHLINRVSPLVIAVGGNDIESLNMLLNCHFVVKQDINDALMEIFSSDVKSISVTENRILIAKTLLKNGTLGNINCNVSSTSLSAAVRMGDYELVELLCQQTDKQQQLQSSCGSQPLLAAAKSGRWDIVKLLLEYKTNLDNIDKYSNSPLDCALRHGHLEIAQLLIQHGAKIDIISALQSAVTHQLPDYMKFLYENCRPEVTNVMTKGSIEVNDLFVSADQRGNLEIIGYLIDAGADVNQENSNTETLLGESKDGDVANLLINRGANVNLPLQNGDSLLIHILKKRNMNESSNLNVVKVLLKNGTFVNKKGNRGITPLIAAVLRKADVDVLQLLLDHGADVNDQDNIGNTALMRTVYLHNHINLSFLLEFHRDNKLCVNVQNRRGKTALMYAVLRNSHRMVKQLIQFGADVKVKDIKGNSALLTAVERGNKIKTKILKTLIKAGSDVNCQNNEGFSPLMMAAQNCSIETILNLLHSGADVNAVSKMDSTKTALSYLPCCQSHLPTFRRCLQAFLKKGASLSYIDPCFIHNLILDNTDYIYDMTQGPIDVASVNMDTMYLDNEAIPTVSTLCVALVASNISLARYFVENMFLTSSDVTSLTGNTEFRNVLENRERQESLTLLDELSSQPWSLLQLAFVSVQSAVGSYPGRENRVNLLPLPQVMKDKLLFKSLKLQLNSLARDDTYFEDIQVELSYSDGTSSDGTESDGTDSDCYTESDDHIDSNDDLSDSSDSF